MTDARARPPTPTTRATACSRKQTPHGTLTYTYDAAGNVLDRALVERRRRVGRLHLRRAEPARDRRPTTAQPRAATAYAYDANGNLASTLYPNGVQTTYTYNALNRLTQVSAAKGGGARPSYAYTLGAAGNRLSVTEQSGRTVSYTYDALYRLTQRDHRRRRRGQRHGRLHLRRGRQPPDRTSTVAAVPSTTSTYDANDRLTSDTYDANGNTTAPNGNAYAYDFENRLTGVERRRRPLRLRRRRQPRRRRPSGGVTTHYLVDTNNHTGHAQVVEEIAAAASAQYTYGHDLHQPAPADRRRSGRRASTATTGTGACAT